LRSASDGQPADLQAKKKPGKARLYGFSLLSLNETRRVGEGCLGILYIAQCVANDLFGDTGTLAALGCDASCFTHLTIAAAPFIDSIANLAVGDTLAKTDVHKALPVHFVDAGMLIRMRIIVKARPSAISENLRYFPAAFHFCRLRAAAAGPGVLSLR
jgi:hypothetical protein